MKHNGRSPSRTTLWRRKNGICGSREPEPRRAELIQWVGSIVQLLRETGKCHYYRIKSYPRASDFDPKHDCIARFYLHDEALRRDLFNSPYPGEQLTVAAFEIGMVNYSKPDKGGLSEIISELRQTLKAEGNEASLISTYLRECAKNPQAAWLSEFIGPPAKREFRWAHGQKELSTVAFTEAVENMIFKPSGKAKGIKAKKATVVQNVAELDISRKMASYWRKHQDYPACRDFLASLVGRPLPKAPDCEYGTYSRPELFLSMIMRLVDDCKEAPFREQLMRANETDKIKMLHTKVGSLFQREEILSNCPSAK